MFRKQALSNTLRAPRRSILFLALLVLISALLATSLGMSVSLSRALTLCRENYVTIGLAEYIGGGYPELRRMDSAIENAAQELSNAAKEDDSLLYYEPTRMALGHIDGLRPDNDFDKAVLVVRIEKVLSDYDETTFYYATVKENLFTAKEVENKLVRLDTDETLSAGRTYLVHCTYYSGYTSNPTFGAESYTSPDGSVTLSGIEDITTEDGGYEIPAGSPYLLAAKTYAVTASALTLWYSDHAQDLYPFQQNVLTLTNGDWCSEGGCLLSEVTAKTLGVSVGDSVTLSTAAREGALLDESYWAGSGFDTEKTYRVDGIFSGPAEWNDAAFLPVAEETPTVVASYTLGQFRFVNGCGQDYLDAIADALPSGVRVTLYDQGYAAAESGLGTMLRSVGVISAVCLAAGLGFLLLFAYLLIFRQQNEARNMIRLGVRKRDILRYDAFCALYPALAGCTIGFAVSVGACGALEKVVSSVLAQGSNTDLYFSSSALSVSRSAGDYLSAPSVWLLLAISAAVLLTATALAVGFGALVLRKKKARRRALTSRSGTRSRSLRGGSARYALLSLTRGGMRSLVPMLALLCAAVMFCRLAAVTVKTQEELSALRRESSVRGYATDVYGRSLGGLVVSAEAVDMLSAIDGVEDVSVSRSTHYDFIYVTHEDGTTEGPGYHPRTNTNFGFETFMNYLLGCDELLFTSSLHGAPEFLYAKSVEAEYLDGWDESLFTETKAEVTRVPIEGYPGYYSLELNGLVCVMPSTMMEQYHIALGDTVVLEIAAGNSSYGSYPFLVVGSFTQEGAANHIYAPISILESSNDLSRQLLDHRGSGHFDYSSVTFTVPDCSKLEQVKSELYRAGFSEANSVRSVRAFLTLNDSSYLSSLHAAQQRLWYMERLFPLIDVLAVALAFFLGRLLLGRRAGEMRTLRSMGASPATVFWSLWGEQLALVLLGAGAGILAAFLLDEWSRSAGLWLLAFALSYLFGTLAVLLRVNRRAILKNRREQEE